MIGGGGGQIPRRPNPPASKIYFLLRFRPLYFENVGKCKIVNVSRKKLLKYSNFWGSSPAVFKSAGVLTPATPPPPSSTPLIAKTPWHPQFYLDGEGGQWRQKVGRVRVVNHGVVAVHVGEPHTEVSQVGGVQRLTEPPGRAEPVQTLLWWQRRYVQDGREVRMADPGRVSWTRPSPPPRW